MNKDSSGWRIPVDYKNDPKNDLDNQNDYWSILEEVNMAKKGVAGACLEEVVVE